MAMTILETLENIAKSDTLALHMPGHKRKSGFTPYLTKLAAYIDVTEITGTDSLHGAEGIIKNAMEKAKILWQTHASYYLINGSTAGILSAMHAVTRRSDKILMARACHKSVYNAVELCGLEAEYILQKQSAEGFSYPVDAEEIEEKLNQNSNIKLVVITSPTYEGYVADVEKIAEICHRHSALLLVDEAHGAHLGFSDYFYGTATKTSADIIVQSLHKTLPSLTSTAILHINSENISLAKIENSLSIFETSSPSYILMSSIEACVDLIDTDGDSLFSAWQKNLEKFYIACKNLKKLKVIDEASNTKDPSKIIISTKNVKLSGMELKNILRERHNIELEMAYGDYALAMTSMADTAEDLERFFVALCEIDKLCEFTQDIKSSFSFDCLPKRKMTAEMARNSDFELIKIEEAIGKISYNYIWAYPPGVPLLVAGEVIDERFLALVSELNKASVNLYDNNGSLEAEIACVLG